DEEPPPRVGLREDNRGRRRPEVPTAEDARVGQRTDRPDVRRGPFGEDGIARGRVEAELVLARPAAIGHTGLGLLLPRRVALRRVGREMELTNDHAVPEVLPDAEAGDELARLVRPGADRPRLSRQ